MSMAEGFVFSIVRASLHDGPGVRTVVYMKGCSMRCAWCHNPEGLTFGGEILRYPDRCIACGRCAEVCPESLDMDKCRRCGKCAEVCPAEARVLCGKRYTADELMAVIRKDKHYYRRSGGGVTFSGGECLLQPEFVTETARRCREEGIHTLCETALHIRPAHLTEAAAQMDMIYADCKIMDAAAHKRWAGADNGLILSNLRWLSENHGHVVVRIPMIPGVNDGEDNLSATALFLRDCGNGIRAVELLKYNELAGSKYAAVGRDAALFAGWVPQSDAEMEEKRAFLRGMLPDGIAVV